MNWIQAHILLELTRHSRLRYSELRPDGVEGNLFLYHLEGLIKARLIEKNERQYSLTNKGKQFAGTISLATGRPRPQPKLLTAIIARNKADEYLMVRWHREPNTGLISFPHGMMHFGRSLLEMATSELAEKAGLRGQLSHLGEVYVRGMRGEEVDRHFLVHLFKADSLKLLNDFDPRADVSEPFWATLGAYQPSDFVPGFYEIAQLVLEHNSAAIFADITVQIPD